MACLPARYNLLIFFAELAPDVDQGQVERGQRSLQREPGRRELVLADHHRGTAGTRLPVGLQRDGAAAAQEPGAVGRGIGAADAARTSG